MLRLEGITKGIRPQNMDYELGHCLSVLSFNLENGKTLRAVETVLLSILASSHVRISVVNANLIGVCLAEHYAVQKETSFSLLYQQLETNDSSAMMTVAGAVAQRLGNVFVQQLGGFASRLLRSSNFDEIACQSLRRIMKTKGVFEAPIVRKAFTVVAGGLSSANERIQIESLKTLHVLVMNDVELVDSAIEKVVSMFGTRNVNVSYHAAKALGKIVSSCFGKDFDTEFEKYAQIFLDTLRFEDKVETLSRSAYLYFRSKGPLQLHSKLGTIAYMTFSCANFGLSLFSMNKISYALCNAVVEVCGATSGFILTSDFVKLLEQERSITNGHAIVTMTVITQFKASVKTLAIAGRQIFPVVFSRIKMLTKAAGLFYYTIAKESKDLGRIFLNKILSALLESSTDGSEEFCGLCRIASMVICGLGHVDCAQLGSLKTIIDRFVISGDPSDLRFGGALLLAACLRKVRENVLPISKLAEKVDTGIVEKNLKSLVLFLRQVDYKEAASLAMRASKQILEFEPASSTCLGFWDLFVHSEWEDQKMKAIQFFVTTLNKKLEQSDSEDLCDGFQVSISHLLLDRNIRKRMRTILCEDITRQFHQAVAMLNHSEMCDLVESLAANPTKGNLSLLTSLALSDSGRDLIPEKMVRQLLEYKAKTTDCEIMKYLARCSSAVVRIFPSHLDKFLLELGDADFLGTFIASYVGVGSAETLAAMQCFTIIQHCLMHTQSLSCLKALTALSHAMSDDSSSSIAYCCECCCYSYVPTQEMLEILSQICCSEAEAAAHCLFHFPNYKSQAAQTAMKLNPGAQGSHIEKYKRITAPRNVLQIALQAAPSERDIELMFMFLQQTNSDDCSRQIMNMFSRFPHNETWSLLCRQVLVDRCAFKGTTIVPNSKLCSLASKIASQLVTSFRSCLSMQDVDNLVAVAASLCKGRKKEKAFRMLSEIVREGSISVSDCSTALLQSAFKQAVNEFPLEPAIDFSLCYLRFIQERNRGAFLESVQLMSQRLQRTNTDGLSFRFYSQLFSLGEISLIDSALLQVGSFLCKACKNQACLIDLNSQIFDFCRLCLSLPQRKVPCRVILLLLLQTLEVSFTSEGFAAALWLMRESRPQETEARYLLSLIARKTHAISYPTDDIFSNNANDEDDLDQGASSDILFTYLGEITELFTREAITLSFWRELMYHALYPQVYPTVVLQLLAFSTLDCSALPSVVERCLVIPTHSERHEVLALAVSKCPHDVCERIITDLVLNGTADLDTKCAILELSLRRFGHTKPSNIDQIASFIRTILYPNGLNLLTSLLSQESSALLALSLVPRVLSDITDQDHRPELIKLCGSIVNSLAFITSPSVPTRDIQLEICRLMFIILTDSPSPPPDAYDVLRLLPHDLVQRAQNKLRAKPWVLGNPKFTCLLNFQ